MSVRSTPAMINTSRLHQYPILSLPSHLTQPSSPSMISRSSPSTRKALSSSTSNPSTLTSPPTPLPSRLSRFLSSLQPLPPSSPPSSHSRTSHRVLCHLHLTPPSSSLISAALSHTHLDPLTSFTVHHTSACQDSLHHLLHGLSSHHTTLTHLTLHHCTAALHFPSLVHRLPSLLPHLSHLSLWACDLSSLHRHDILTLLSLPHLATLDLSHTSLSPSALHSLTAALHSPSLPPITSLDLSATALDATAFHSLATALALPHPTLSALTLHSNPTSVPTLLHLLASLSTNSTLTYLDLRWTAPLNPNPLPPPSPTSPSSSSSSSPSPSSSPLPLDTLLSSLSPNQSLTSLLLCGYADAFTANLQSAIDLALLRNKQRQTSPSPSLPAHPRSLPAAHAVQSLELRASRAVSLEEWDNPLHGKAAVMGGGGMRLSPPLTFRSYANSLSSTSPFSLALEPVGAVGGHVGVGNGSAVSAGVGGGAGSGGQGTVDGKLSSVVLQQEEEISRQGRIIARLRAMVKRQEEGLKSGRAQLRRFKGGAAAAPAAPAQVGEGGGQGGVVESPVESPAGSDRGSFSGESGESGGQGVDGEEEVVEGGGGEFRVNLDLAATVVLLESEKNAQQRLMDEMRQVMQRQEEDSKQQHTDVTPAPLQQATDTAPPSPLTVLSPPSPTPVFAAATEAAVEDSERGRLIAELTELRHEVARLQAAQRAAEAGGVVVGLRRESSGVHWASVVQSLKEEGERVVKEKEEKIQALLSAQRVLAESREVKLQQQTREWREKEEAWELERERMKEEVRRLRKRLNRVSLESQLVGGSRQGSVRLAAPPLQSVVAGVGVEGGVGGGGGGEGAQSAESEEDEEDEESSSEESEVSGSPRFHIAPAQLSSTQPLPSSSPPLLPTKPQHSLGLVIAARIAAFESKRGEESESIRERMGLGKGAGAGDLLNRKRASMAEAEEEKMPD